MAYLALVRHGQTENNSQPGMRTGQLDISLTEKGRQQAREVAPLLNDYHFDRVFRSTLIRTQETLDEISSQLDWNLPVTISSELIERGWGDIEGLSKTETDERYPESIQAIWWTWHGAPPGGESYQQVLDRAMGYYQSDILPLIKEGENILIVGHQAVFKLMRMALEDVAQENFQTLAMENGEVYLYDINEKGIVQSFKKLTRE